MHKNGDYTQLVKQAQLGNRESLDRLTKAAWEPLYEHVYRITLKRDLAQDIVQESMLEMFKVLNNLRKADGFWPWLCGIAFNKIRHHQRRQRRRRTVSLSEVGYENFGKEKQDELADVITEELKQIVLAAMSKLRPRHRAVLTMRCYDEMEYSQIAKLMDCSEFAVRMLFCRAKKSLGKQLSRSGLGKGVLLLALTVFGNMTASSKAAAAQISVTAATTEVGMAATLAGMAISKSALIALGAAGAVAVGSVALTPGTDRGAAISQQGQAQNFPSMPLAGSTINDMEERWYYFPDGAGKPAMTRLIKSNSRGEHSYCQWLQNEAGNYYFDKSANTIYLMNHRMWNQDLTVRSLPTDEPQLTGFVAEVQGSKAEMEPISAHGRGLLVVAQRDSRNGPKHWRIIRHHNVLEEDYFRCDWPSGTKIIDKRDAMHKLGWTYFRIEGVLGGRNVSGMGLIPFVYETSKQYQPWLKLDVGDYARILDLPGGASVCDAGGKVVAVYPAGSFFRGLSRPWMGLHTIDTIRRDAAARQLRFETKLDSKTAKSEVTVFSNEGKLIYTIDMDRDVIDEITFDLNKAQGQLRFSYVDDIGQPNYKRWRQRINRYSARLSKSEGLLWLMRLGQGDLVK